MDPSIVLRKTDKGIEELKTRVYGLPLTLRTALILVDGKADVEGLYKKAPSLTGIEECLGTLLKEGFIQASSDTNTAIMVSDDLVTRAKWEIVEMVGSVLGEETSHRATKRFTAVADTQVAIKQALNECGQFIALTIDEEKARIVQERGLEILSKIKPEP